eukprot:6335647-Pyramimonas_sp.AAC.1
MGLQCAAWSRARSPPLRSADFLLGLPGLAFVRAEAVKTGTFLMLLAVELAVYCVERDVYFFIENPATSLSWDFEPMQA